MPRRRTADRPPARRGPRDRARWPAAGRPAASSAARSSRPRGTRAGEWSLPPIGPRPSSDGTPMPGRSCSRRTRRPSRRRATSKPSRRAIVLGVLDEPAAALELLHRPPAARIARPRPSCRGPSVAAATLADRRLGRVERRRASTARTSTSSSQRSATTLGRVPPPMTPTLTVTPGQRPLSACRSRTSRRRLEDRAAPLLGLDAGMRRPAVDGAAAVSRMPLRADTMSPLARAHSRTRQASASAASARMCGVDDGRADLLVRVGDERRAARTAAPPTSLDRAP